MKRWDQSYGQLPATKDTISTCPLVRKLEILVSNPPTSLIIASDILEVACVIDLLPAGCQASLLLSTSVSPPLSDSASRGPGTWVLKKESFRVVEMSDTENFHHKVSCLVELIWFVSRHSTPLQCIYIAVSLIDQITLLQSTPTLLFWPIWTIGSACARPGPSKIVTASHTHMTDTLPFQAFFNAWLTMVA